MQRNSDGTFADTGKGGEYQVKVRLREPYATWIKSQINPSDFVRQLIVEAYNRLHQ